MLNRLALSLKCNNLHFPALDSTMVLNLHLFKNKKAPDKNPGRFAERVNS